MPAIEEISRLLRRYHDGAYTLREVLPLLVKHTPQERLADLKGCLPGDIWASFVMWIQHYPLDGGVQIRDDESLPREKIEWLRDHTRNET